MSETTPHVEAPDKGGENIEMVQKELDDQRERPKSPSINVTPTQALNEEGEQPAAVPAKGQQSDERIEDLVSLFRDFLEAAPNKSVPTSSPLTQPNKAGRKRFFGLAKGFSQETGSNNKYDYEHKYPRDRFGEEVSENSRIWLTYLDEAESFDRERAEGWKETVDVLLVFAGLFSGVITTFISQASQSLQKDNTQVSASLLFEIAQVLRAQSNGMPTNTIPNSTINPNSPFAPSTNAVLVNGLWFTSLAITLSAALFAVLAKQWLYYYLSSITGTANERVRARQLRFRGFESWKVAAIIELLPILLHLAVGMFLTGIIILLFPLDVHIAGTIVFIAGITYTSYLISVMLPIWYPECPYTTSLTIYIGIFFLTLGQVFEKINQVFQAIWEKINFKARFTIEHIGQSLVRHGFMLISKLADAAHRGFQRLRSTIFSDKLPKFTKWREENIKKAVKHATSLDSDALGWLYDTSADRSVHKMIARCAAVHPTILGDEFYYNLRALEVSETNVVDLRYGLCFDLLSPIRVHLHWNLLRSIPDVDVIENQLEGEYQTYLHLAKTISSEWDPRTIHNAINGDFSLPLVMWHYLLKSPTDAMVAVHILTDGIEGLFDWKFDPTRDLIRDAGLLRFNSQELGWWKFGYLFRYFELGDPDYSSEAKAYETRYLLLITIYHNLTSDHPMITDKQQRRNSLEKAHVSFSYHLESPNRPSLEDAFRFFTDICCMDSFWCESMTDDARKKAVFIQLFGARSLWANPRLDNCHLPFTDGHNLSLIYQWYSRDLSSNLSSNTPPLFPLLLVPQNRHHLSAILSNDPNALSHFSNCIYNLANYAYIDDERTNIYQILMDLLKHVDPKNSLFIILYDPSVLVQIWKLLVYCRWEMKKYFGLVKSKLKRDKLDKLFAVMNTLARTVDWENIPDVGRYFYEDPDNVRSALLASAREFGQLIGVSHVQLEATADQSAPDHENAASDKDHDTEERAQMSEHQNYHSRANWMKNVFKFIWSKTPRQID